MFRSVAWQFWAVFYTYQRPYTQYNSTQFKNTDKYLKKKLNDLQAKLYQDIKNILTHLKNVYQD